jgi:hypothetical protein
MASTNTRNVVVGAAQIYLSNNDGITAPRPSTTPNDIKTLLGTTTGKSAAAQLNSNTDYRNVGLTSTGLELNYQPTYSEVKVDQLLDAARLFKSDLKVELKTELSEATLENLQLAWGQMDSYYNSTGSSVTALSQTDPITGEQGATLNLAAGSLGDAPVERVFIAVGNAPYTIGEKSGGTTYAGRNKERVYIARRVVSMDTTMHSLKRDAATVFPVAFRMLPDDTDASYGGSEYGVVIDRVWGSN